MGVNLEQQDQQDGQPTAEARAAAAGKPTDEARPAWRRAWRAGAAVWLASHLGYALITIVAWLGRPGPASLGGAVRAWRQWDVGWYTLIARYGYTGLSGVYRIKAPAFPPLYPLLMRLADPVLPGDLPDAGLVLASAFGLVLFAVLFRFTEEEFGTAVARRTVWYLAVFPTAFFLVAPYNTSLFLALVVGSVYAMRRGRWWLAGVLGALALFTRAAAVVLVVPFAYEYLRQHGWQWRRIRLDALGIALIPGALLVLMAYFRLALGDWFAMNTASAAFARSAHNQVKTVWRAVYGVATKPLFTDLGIINLVDLLLAIAAATLVVLAMVGPWRFRRDQLALPLYGLAVVGFSLTFVMVPGYKVPLMGTSRYVLEAFPIFMVLGIVGARSVVDRIVVFAGLTLQTVLCVHFLHGGWVA
jgi:Dolichyl-phosphate-mannose-protein mannosyltransferase